MACTGWGMACATDLLDKGVCSPKDRKSNLKMAFAMAPLVFVVCFCTLVYAGWMFEEVETL